MHPRVKVTHGADGSSTDTSATAPLPVRQSNGSAVQTFAELDMDVGGGVVNRIGVALAIPGAGGPVAGGSATNPIMIDPTNLTFTKVIGPTEHDEPLVENPVVVAYRANANEPAVVADGDVVYPWGDLQGRLVVILGHPAKVADGSTHGPKAVGLGASVAETEVIAAPGAGQSIHITEVIVVNSHATQKSALALKDGTTQRAFLSAPFNNGTPGRMTFNPPWKLTANTNFKVQQTDAADMSVTVHFYTAP